MAAANTSGANFTNVRLYVELVTDNNGPDGLGCDTSTSGWGWRNCTYATPTGRSEAAERQNFATWYSFHRTRMKAAKAGVSYAFSELGEEYRVGFDILGTSSTVRRPIPVSSDGGLFRNEAASTNRSAFFDDFFSVTASGYTPLRRALRRVGEYYRDATATGPYGGTGAAQLACRQNFAILTTDGYWNGNNDESNSTYTGLSGDEDNGALISGPNGQTYQYTPVRPYSASAEGTLADVAMHYWKTDLRTNLDNIVPTSSNNPAFWQHMVTFGISLGLKGNLDPDTDLPALTAGTKTWGAVSTANDTDPDKIDDLWHAAVNSRGSFAAATDPQAFVAAIRSALASVVERTASGSNVSANSTSLTSDAMLFQGRFISGRWSGDLFAYSLAVSGSGNTPVWSASANIPAPGSRNILTWNGTGGATFPTTAQAAALNSPKAGVTNYIRGDRSLEASHGGTFRDRMHALGDIINSSPAFDPATNTVYVGANDGMLHAFNGATGVERFAYIPGNIDLVGLESLVEPDYAHRYFVDGPIAISPRSLTPNVSYLVGALGRGGRGVYGLNVTNPGSMGTGNVLWDFKTTAHAKMGMVLNTPVFARMNNGDVAVLVPNGPNSPADTAVLYVLNPTNGNVIAEIDTGTGTGWGGATAPNGLSGLRGYDYDGNGTVDLIYAGDLRGNVWKFDVSSNNPSNWTNATNRTILFTAVDGSGNRQPISGAPAIAIDPLTYNTWVYFGTGRFLNTDDIKDANNNPNLSVHTWYGLIDGDPITGRAQLQRRTIIASGTLNGRPVRAFEQPTSLDTTKRGWYIDLLRPPVPGTAQGERIIADTAVVGSRVIVPSIVPTSSDCDAGGTGFVNVLDAFTGASPPGAFFDLDGDGVFTDDVITLDNGQTVPVGSVSFVDGMPTGSGVIVPPAGSGSTIGRYEVGGTGGARGGAAADLSQIYSRKSWRELTGD
ncbi:pilus assembly protein [Arenimonas composti]|uniref:PilY1 beta-propeller domain-containing protein n=1 Tax=Arenimonas composti TR7-09 = DSM 18010 TaxID=1121013 RepID=A0A091C3A0_9GAMM|nr:PilC/PilY family type IV pilus protein [Arenimonas composti]KFN51125.1 hypothetical protein P873_04300 [Arenimonas composti TR7-09 = DSM 18010]